MIMSIKSGQVTKWQLMNAFINGEQCMFSDYSKETRRGAIGYISNIEREDGSGSSFNIYVSAFQDGTSDKRTFYVRTID
jgi:hypothetical protein